MRPNYAMVLIHFEQLFYHHAGVFTTAYKLISSAYILILTNLSSLTISLTNRIYIKGPNMVPCGTELST